MLPVPRHEVSASSKYSLIFASEKTVVINCSVTTCDIVKSSVHRTNLLKMFFVGLFSLHQWWSRLLVCHLTCLCYSSEYSSICTP